MDIVLDTNMFIHRYRCAKPITLVNRELFYSIKNDFEKLIKGQTPAWHRFVVIPTVGVELLFDKDNRHEYGINMIKVSEYKDIINRCFTAELHRVEYDKSSFSSFFYKNHMNEIRRLELALISCRRYFKSDYSIDIFETNISESKAQMSRLLDFEIPATITEVWKYELYERFAARAGLYHIMFPELFDDTGISLTMVLFIFCAMFHIGGKDKGRKYPLSSDYIRHNFLSDYVIFNYCIVREDSLILTSDSALAKRGLLIGKTLQRGGTFLGVSA